jgi:hypothetical protein
MIPSEIVTQTWQRMSQVPVDQAPELVEQMKDEQPVALSFLLHLEDLPFNQYEQELLFYFRSLFNPTDDPVRFAASSSIRSLNAP